MTVEIIRVHDIVEDNSKTIRENNLDKAHNIPLGTLVETTVEDDRGVSRSRTRALLFVVGHNRDCDGTPLYSLSMTHPDFMEDVRVTHQHGTMRMPYNAEISRSIYYRIHSGYPEDSLRVIEDPVYDPSFLRQWLPVQMYRDWGKFDMLVLYKQIGDLPDEEHSFNPGDYPEGTCYVFERQDPGEGPDFEAMQEKRESIFAKPFRGTVIEVHSPMCLSLRLDRKAWRIVENWEKGMSWEAACWATTQETQDT